MADVHTPDAIPATNASQTTRYFNLPLFIANDKPSWLVDWNGAMGQIDSILEDISVASEGAVADVQTIQTQINALSQTVTSLEATVQTAVEDVAAMETTVASHESRMDTIEQDLITQNNLIKTLSDAVTAMQTTVAQLNNRVQVLESSVSAQGVDLAAVQTALSTLENTVSSQGTQISGLDTRVTALENSPSGSGMPAVNVSSARTNVIFINNSSQQLAGQTDTHGNIILWQDQQTGSHDCLVYSFRLHFESALSGNEDLVIKAGIGNLEGNTVAHFEGGFSSGANYKEFDVSTFMLHSDSESKAKITMNPDILTKFTYAELVLQYVS